MISKKLFNLLVLAFYVKCGLLKPGFFGVNPGIHIAWILWNLTAATFVFDTVVNPGEAYETERKVLKEFGEGCIMSYSIVFPVLLNGDKK